MIRWRALVFDLIENSFLRLVFYTRRRWITWLVASLAVVALSLACGWLLGEFGALVVAVLVAGAIYMAWGMLQIDLVYLSVIAVITLLPFGSLPFRIGFTPTFLDVTLLALFASWLLPYFLGSQKQFVATRIGGPVVAFMLLAIAAFVAGLSHGALTSYLIRHFAEILLSISCFFVVVNTVTDMLRLQRIIRYIILGATAAAVIGIVLYLLPDSVVIRLLSALGRFGYPQGVGVLRYVRDDPELMKRATSTSVDPNVLGSLLNISIALAVPQLFARRPIVPRWIMLGILGILALGVGLTISRSAILGAALSVLFLALIRYRRLLPWMAAGLALFIVLPWTQELLAHFLEGFSLQDLSTQMRMGEYKDALILIQRYPFLGVGFAGAPDLDIYVAVADVYMIIAAQMGLIGLAAFLAVAGGVLWRFWRCHRTQVVTGDLEPLWYGLHAAVVGGLVSGIFDHFFFSLDFHHSVTLFWLLIGLATAAMEMVALERQNRI